MSPEEGDRAYHWDMLEAARQVVSFSAESTYDSYISDSMRRMAIERGLEVIGQAAQRVSPRFRESHPEIPWRSLVGLRNVLAHEYGELRHDRLWEIATRPRSFASSNRSSRRNRLERRGVRVETLAHHQLAVRRTP
jgi:uncharacterized protein with HEPN domain